MSKSCGKRSKNESLRHTIESDYTTANWNKQGLPMLEQLFRLVQKDKIIGRWGVPQVLSSGACRTTQAAKAKSQDLVEEHNIKKRELREAAAELRLAGPQLALAEPYKSKQVPLHIRSALIESEPLFSCKVYNFVFRFHRNLQLNPGLETSSVCRTWHPRTRSSDLYLNLQMLEFLHCSVGSGMISYTNEREWN